MWNKCTKCGIFVDNNSRCGQNAAAFCVGEQPHRRSTKKAARGRSMRVSPTQSRKGSRDNVPCRVQGQRPCWGLGQRPNCSASNLLKGKIQQGAGSEASLPLTLRVRRRAPNLLIPTSMLCRAKWARPDSSACTQRTPKSTKEVSSCAPPPSPARPAKRTLPSR